MSSLSLDCGSKLRGQTPIAHFHIPSQVLGQMYHEIQKSEPSLKNSFSAYQQKQNGKEKRNINLKSNKKALGNPSLSAKL
ncbi:hypothetical protein TNCV_4971171 [Trichonephila clavipes]|nr:hypothetical protein TNCV_4971171 [Trichonephila clavipes]